MPSLLEQFLKPDNFRSAWEKVASKQGCAGVDGETIAHFAGNADRYLAGLRQAVAERMYYPMPLRQLFIPKQDGWRELGVPTVRDRIVQQALLQVLHPVMEREFAACSFAYRPGRSHLMAVRQVAQWRDRGYEWVLDADIVQYFDNIEHSRLLTEIKERVNQPWISALVQAWIGAGVLTQEGIVLPLKGVPQGAVISPILANVYLDDFDELLSQAGWKLVRFADDFLVLARSRQRIVEARLKVAQLLESMGLQLHPDKTQITDFARGFRFLGHAFAGDLIVPIRKPIEQPVFSAPRDSGLRLVHTDRPASVTSMQQALIEALKQEEKPIPPPLFVVLGYKTRSEQVVSIESDESIWEVDMATLYLVQQGTTIRRELERFVVRSGENHSKKAEEAAALPASFEVPIREVERVLVFGNVQLTTPVIATCLEFQIPVIFLSQLGEYKGQLWSAESADLTMHKAQFQRQQDEEFQRVTAREIVQGKLWNSKQLLLRLNRKRQLPEVMAAIESLTEGLEAVALPENTATLDQIRGYEGAGAARYFAALSKLITNPGFSLKERAFHPPTDPMNSLLSFGYTLLYNNVLSLLLAEGLNPYLGNLHGAERPKTYLAFDLMEEFRSPIVDTLVMKLVNQKILSPTDFTYPTEKGGVYLEEVPRRIFLKHFEARMSEKIKHPDVQEPVSYRRVIQLQIQRYGKAVLGNRTYEAHRRVI